MLIGTFRTIPLKNAEEEWGYIEHEFLLDKSVIEDSRSPKEFLLHSIAVQLRLLVERTNCPMELWDFQPTEEICRLTSLPESIPFR